MEKWDRIVIRNGNPVMLGANKNEEGMNFAAEVLPGAEAALVLYQKGNNSLGNGRSAVPGHFRASKG